MATHSSILAWRIPWTEKPGGLQSIGSLRVVHKRNDLKHTCGRDELQNHIYSGRCGGWTGVTKGHPLNRSCRAAGQTPSAGGSSDLLGAPV